MLEFTPLYRLPTSEELPCSDDTPVDNELQNNLPNLLRAILLTIWGDRTDWFFGVDMGIYDRVGQIARKAIVPDGFLSLGVPRHKRQWGRLSYVLAEENNIPPIFVLEFVSRTYGDEYDEKLLDYARLGVLYYVIYNPEYWQRDRHDPFEVYRLEQGQYVRQASEPFWMPEIELGIGRIQGVLEGQAEQEWLTWFTAAEEPLPIPEAQIQQLQEQVEQERQRAEQEAQKAAKLADKLRELGIDPEAL